jgi:hypothetical protein
VFINAVKQKYYDGYLRNRTKNIKKILEEQTTCPLHRKEYNKTQIGWRGSHSCLSHWSESFQNRFVRSHFINDDISHPLHPPAQGCCRPPHPIFFCGRLFISLPPLHPRENTPALHHFPLYVSCVSNFSSVHLSNKLLSLYCTVRTALVSVLRPHSTCCQGHPLTKIRAACSKCRCRLVASVSAVLWQVSLPSCGKCQCRPVATERLNLPSCCKRQCRPVASVSSVLWQVSVPSCGKCQCRPVESVSAVLWQVSVPSCGNCQCRPVASVSAVLWQVSVTFCGKCQCRPVATERLNLPSCGKRQCRPVASVSAVLWQVSVPSCGKCQCRPVASVSAVLWYVSMPSCGKCQCRFVANVSVALWQLKGSISGKGLSAILLLLF